MALQIETITDSIADIDIDGITIKTLRELKEGWDAYQCPLLCPRPNEFVNGFSFTPANLGTGTSRKLDVSYNLNYRYFHAPIGTGDLTETWAQMVINVMLIIDAILENDAITGLIDLSINNLTLDGEVSDGSNNRYHGCDLTFRVMEFVN